MDKLTAAAAERLSTITQGDDVALRSPQNDADIPSDAENWPAPKLLTWGLERWRSRIALASSFGAEGMVLIDMASKIGSDFRVFTLDTDFFFPETYELMQRVERRYNIRIERCHPPLSPQMQARLYGDGLWLHDPDRCCELRKIEPLQKKLAGLDAWITAIRREQSPARAGAPKVHWDEKFGLIKLNPIADWNVSQIWDYIRSHQVPYNPLYDRSYSSIGCTHCTRAISPGENSRDGRWPGFAKIECGLHTKD